MISTLRSLGVAAPLLVTSTLTGCRPAEGVGDEASNPGVAYLATAHSHNDYERERPLLDAVEQGFASVEVDVFLIDGRLLVAHEVEGVDPSATLAGLYLDPLRELAQRNGGSIHGPDAPPLQLLIDVKSDAEETYRALDDALGLYADLFTSFARGRPEPGPVTAVLSGNRAMGLVIADSLRYVAIDGRIDDDRSEVSTDAMPLVSIDWEAVEPLGSGDRLGPARELVELLHEEGRKVRFWGAPDSAEAWSSLLSIGVDYVGTDDTGMLRRFLMAGS